MIGIVALVALAAAQDTSLVGLWHARRWFGPEVRGEVVVRRSGDRWRAEVGARSAAVRVAGDSVHFALPAGGRFRGRLARGRIVGQWIQPRVHLTGTRFATPLTLSACGAGCYAGMIQPLEDDFTFYLDVTRRPDGTLGAFLRNPERNQGRFIGLERLVRRGDTIELRDARDSILETTVLRFGDFNATFRGSTFEFGRLPADSFTFFYPRGHPTGAYTYAPPHARDDGWAVAHAESVGMSADSLAAMVRALVNASADSAHAHRLHGILVARHGRLVLEEYFFGEHADKPHDTRSASKTLVTVVLGAAMQAGLRVGPETPVYATLGRPAASLDPRQRAMTLRHLLTMTSGLDCDDNGADRPGNENTVTSGDNPNPDWLNLVLDLAVVRDPGARPIYCSINPYLAGEVVARAAGRAFVDLAWDLVGAPLQMGRYHLMLAPTGEAYMGGGARFLPRDFLKLAQLYANGGTWNGRRVVSAAWVRESVEPRQQLGTAPDYGYLWWTVEYPFGDRRVRAHYAAGNGGQYTMLVPELDLVIAAWGGNYADRGNFTTLRELIPRRILPAVVR